MTKKKNQKRIWISGYYTTVDTDEALVKIERVAKVNVPIHLLRELRKDYIIFYDSTEGHYITRKRNKNLFERLFNL